MSTKKTSPLLAVPRGATQRFERLKTKAEKRRAICKDAIAQVEAERYTANMGAFVRLPVLVNEMTGSSGSLQSALHEHQVPNCSVCALGGLLVSQARLNGACPMTQIAVGGIWETKIVPTKPGTPLSNPSNLSPYLRRYFAPEQLKLIEVAFEHGNGAFSASSLEGDRAKRFGHQYGNARDRFIAIMQSIVNHPKALFVP